MIHLREVFDILRREKFYGNLKKCSFVVDQVLFLGYVVSSRGGLMDEEKVKVIVDWPSLLSNKEVRSFMVWLPFIGGSFKILVML